MKINLPEDYICDMETLLGDECSKLIEEYDRPPYRGLRVNTLKCSQEKLENFFEDKITKSPFSPLGYYLSYDYEGIGSLPYHHAGAFYVQEPSAMSAVTLLNISKGDKVLDLCAAPGGKSTQIAAFLGSTGLLWSNEIIKSRANILLSNIERCGVKNAVVSSEAPDRLCSALKGYFDKVLVDAPCSGEGMFRKDEEAIKQWSRANVELCKRRQLEILDNAAMTVRSGGELVYSTCTLSREENEEVTAEFLSAHRDFVPVDSGVSFGRKTDNCGIRIFPMDGGEGHYAVKFKRIGENPYSTSDYTYTENPRLRDFQSQVDELILSVMKAKPYGLIALLKDKILLLPESLPEFKGLNILRAGVVLAEIKKNRLEPHHSLFMSLMPEQVNNCIDYPHDCSDIFAFIKGEELDSGTADKGYCMVSVDGISLGFGKVSAGRLKNKYPKGLRNY